MKKVYEKPCAYIEMMTFEQQIANNCTLAVKNNTEITSCYATHEVYGDALRMFVQAGAGQCVTAAETFCNYTMVSAALHS